MTWGHKGEHQSMHFTVIFSQLSTICTAPVRLEPYEMRSENTHLCGINSKWNINSVYTVFYLPFSFLSHNIPGVLFVLHFRHLYRHLELPSLARSSVSGWGSFPRTRWLCRYWGASHVTYMLTQWMYSWGSRCWWILYLNKRWEPKALIKAPAIVAQILYLTAEDNPQIIFAKIGSLEAKTEKNYQCYVCSLGRQWAKK